MRENRLRWFEHVTGREDSEAVRTVIEMNIEGRNPMKKWLNSIEEDTRIVGVRRPSFPFVHNSPVLF